MSKQALIFALSVLSLQTLKGVSSQQPFPNTPLNVNCDFTTCQNDGKCFGYSSNVSYCVCINGFKGSRCEIPPAISSADTTRATTTTTTTRVIIPESQICTPGVCQNGGQCYVIGGQLGMCGCREGFSGPYCQYQNNAGTTTVQAQTTTQTTSPNILCPDYLSSLCRNGGTCVYSFNPNVLRCICTVLYTGSFCSVPL